MPHARRIASAVALTLLIAAGFAVPSVSAATPQPKVAIIVGPVASSTAAYKSDGDAAYAEALKYTSNVVKVYTPNATWAAAKKAMQGASIVIYMGHGNGFPSPYRSTPWPYSQNGLGLNPKAGGGDSTTQYYGEYYLAKEVKLAPNAIVLLHHLCYASGNSESGKPKPTLAQAKARVDNMAAGWLRAGAAAVVAEGHFGPAWYVHELFTTHKTVDQIFHDSPTYKNHAFSFASSRTPGATAEMDPDGSPGGYWRAVTGHLDTPTDDITGAAYADTGTDPIDFQVPGAASVGVEGAPVYADSSLAAGGAATTSLALGRKLRLTERSGSTTPDGGPIFAVATLDGATTGWMAAADLVPRDSVSPAVWTTDDGDGAFSPNGDGSGDVYSLAGRISESAAWTARFETLDGAVLATKTGSGDTFSTTWSGIVAGSALPDGTYRWELSVRDAWGNPDGTRSGTFVVDTVAPAFDDGVVPTAAGSADLPTFSPNGDGSNDSIGFGYSTNEPGYVDLVASDADGANVRSFATRVSSGPGRVSWDGLDDAGHVARNGVYTVALSPRDYAGNTGAARDSTVAVYKTLSHVASATTVFYPQDLDKYARTERFSFNLSVSATVSALIRNEAGAVVRTMFEAAPMTAGSHLFDWDGRRDDGSMAPRGTYAAAVTATDGVLAATGLAPVVADGFRVTVNDTTPGRGQRIVLYATSPELLRALPRVKVSQPGTSAFSLTMIRTGSHSYKVTITLKRTGRAGTVRFALSGIDGSHKVNRATRTFALH